MSLLPEISPGAKRGLGLVKRRHEGADFHRCTAREAQGQGLGSYAFVIVG